MMRQDGAPQAVGCGAIMRFGQHHVVHCNQPVRLGPVLKPASMRSTTETGLGTCWLSVST
jgi:hypothetical protein